MEVRFFVTGEGERLFTTGGGGGGVVVVEAACAGGFGGVAFAPPPAFFFGETAGVEGVVLLAEADDKGAAGALLGRCDAAPFALPTPPPVLLLLLLLLALAAAACFSAAAFAAAAFAANALAASASASATFASATALAAALASASAREALLSGTLVGLAPALLGRSAGFLPPLAPAPPAFAPLGGGLEAGGGGGLFWGGGGSGAEDGAVTVSGKKSSSGISSKEDVALRDDFDGRRGAPVSVSLEELIEELALVTGGRGFNENRTVTGRSDGGAGATWFSLPVFARGGGFAGDAAGRLPEAVPERGLAPFVGGIGIGATFASVSPCHRQ